MCSNVHVEEKMSFAAKLLKSVWVTWVVAQYSVYRWIIIWCEHLPLKKQNDRMWSPVGKGKQTYCEQQCESLII